jgi:hypothetical protein
MTDQTVAATDVEGAAPQIDSDGVSPTPEGEGTAENNGNREAAKYRVRARDAEAERDALAARVEAMNHRELERLAGVHLSVPADLLSLSCNSVADYLDENGNVDAARVEADAREILSERPGLRKSDPAVDYSQGHGWNPGKGTPTFSDLLK